MKHPYPFSAIVGQEQLKRALLLCAIDPTLGGVLIRGDKGTAKSTAARGLTDVLPPITRVAGCAFNCAPDAPLAECEACQSGNAAHASAPVPFVNLPLGATEDRVLGHLDIERALKDGRKAFQPGLLAAAHRGLLYIDEVNLLPDHLVDVLLDVSAMGHNTVEREGLAMRHPARITLLGTMNLEEGDLRPQLLDRFGLMVEVTAPRDAAVRTEVVRRRLAFEADPASFAAAWQADTDALRARLAAAQAMLAQVTLPDALFAFVSTLCCEFEVASLRADIVMHKAARALAALDGRPEVTAEDVRDAAELVLPHRRRRKPFEQSGLDRERLDELMQQAAPPPPQSAGTGTDAAPEDDSGDTAPADGAAEQVFAAGPAATVGRIDVTARQAHDAGGRRSLATGTRRGHAIGAVPNEAPSRLAVDATLRHALLRNPADFSVTRADLHEKVHAGRQGNLILLVADASGSMAARRRMEMVKASVLGLLQDAYQRRDQVALICFRGEQAELVLPPTRQVELAERALAALPTGGRTPLAHALQLAAHTLAQPSDLTPLLVVISDGRANIALDAEQDPWREALALAGHLAARGTPALVLDTEQDYVRLGRARELAQALQADCLPLDHLSGEQLTLTIRQRLPR
ncbi:MULTISPECIES: putative cobaltochelatase [Ralstonia solanacearum species complex]|uniref:putative cobaltochelatase n=1 Tax=Ralstonia solanacearum species complex TaxID=3116862 RepID=UPI000E5728CE|nr:putative cobaltochelatase [Ralstonia solanacearum]BEU74128.1 putative cobaltochelatase [Ralstonia pseudosolanacearum]AXV79024.1 magnesium chelatase [Ralstonia solanacearum]AXV93043.1 magnesium chelatase [Ralstonia solanacearum]AXW21101.1 magnesium chelatase [Ralstonia solanacearum]AXW77941.1 magnesium chelatase [Ralstonia solanacearum]